MRGFLPETSNVEGMEAVHILFAGDGLYDPGLGDMSRKGKLDKDAVYGVIGIKGTHLLKKGRF